MHDAAEREIDLYRAEIARITAERDRLVTALDNARDELTKLRNILALALSRFAHTGNGWKASVRIVELARWYDEAAIPRPAELRDVK